MDICHQCQKVISEHEYVVNWGSCSECFDKDYTDYLRRTRWQRRWRWLVEKVWPEKDIFQ
jgi:hypothetical protein